MIGSRAWFALMRRNGVYARRNWISTIFEMVLPFCFVWILIAIKEATDLDNEEKNPEIPAFIPGDFENLVPFSYYDYVTALQAEKVCETRRDEDLGISGVHDGSYNWMVPFVRCNSDFCDYLGQDAQPFCEYSRIVVTAANSSDEGGRLRSVRFKNWFYATFPETSRRRTPELTGMPFDFDFVQLWGSPEEMDDFVRREDYGTVDNPKISMGIVFDGDSPTEFKYWIRQNSTNMNAPERVPESSPVVTTTPPTDRLFNNFAKTDLETCNFFQGVPSIGKYDDSCSGQYMYNGVIATQRMIGDFILHESGAAADGYTVADGGVSYAQFPQPAFFATGFFASIEDTMPLLVVLGLLYPVASMIGYIVREKELRQKELMKMMSVTESDIGWSWFVSFVIVHFFTTTFCAIISNMLFEVSDFSFLWYFWGLTWLSLVTFTMAVAAVTAKTARAVLLGLLVFFVGAFLTLAVDSSTARPSVLTLINLHPVAAFSYGLRAIGHLEDLEIGLVGDTLDFSDGPNGYSVWSSFRFLGLDSCIWGLLSWYLNRVITPDYGQGLPLWFFLLPSYWFPKTHVDRSHNATDSGQALNDSDIPIEPVGEALRKQTAEGKTIEIHNLRKQYGEKTAVDGLNMTMYSGHITALLGHNGAGKTTTINMLTGATAPTSGHASVAGKDVRSEIAEIRQDIGICLQHDCLFPLLTVREHIQLFARLKGLYSKVSYLEAENQVDQALVDVALSEKRNTLSKNLSGGMKRKLSVAMAFCGGSQVVFLDEPTSGMDPFSRRFTWDVIRHYRKNRCIILTTHFMDEADILGDRIAIMSEGQLRCAGSSLFLKKTYGVGYQLTIERGNMYSPRALLSFQSNDTDGGESNTSGDDRLKSIVTDAVPDATLLTDVGSELIYQLPVSATHSFSFMFEQLDVEVDSDRISCYGMGITTLNEVFLLVTRGESPKNLSMRSSRFLQPAFKDQNTTMPTMSSSDSDNSSSVTPTKKKELRAIPQIELESGGMFGRHMKALLKKRASYFKRDKKAWICTTIVPSLFVLIGFVVFTFASAERNLSPMTLDLSDYNTEATENRIPFNSPNNPFTCQTGLCAHRQPFVDLAITNERYAFCGYQARFGISQNGYSPNVRNCTISESADVLRGLESNNVVPLAVTVDNILQSSTYLLDTNDAFASSTYGAIWFTHERDSKVDSGDFYNDTVISLCEAAVALSRGNYTGDCSRFAGVGYVIQYNFTAIHAVLMYENLANEALVKHATGNPNILVETTIAPLPITELEAYIGAGEDAFVAWFLVVLSFPFIAGAYASFVVQEKKSKAKHLQTVAGVEPFAYWLSTFLWDVFNYQIPLWITVALMFAFKVDILTTMERHVFPGIVALLFLFGPAAAGFSYCVSFGFRTASMCNIFIIIFGFLIGMGGPLTCFILNLLAIDPRSPNPNLSFVADIITWVLRVTPSFCLGKGLFHVINIDTFVFLESEESLSAWSEPILLYEVYFLAAQSIFYLLLAIQLDKWSTNPSIMSVWRSLLDLVTCRCFKNSKKVQVQMSTPDDDDVLAEQEHVLSGAAANELIVLNSLTKVYDDGKVAVDRLTLGISPGECFGLLGINGAGKTTTMGILTAEFPPTRGSASLAGFSVTREPQKTRRLIGYCPQFDAHFLNLTGREHVELYASIKGIPKSLISEIAGMKLDEVGLSSVDSDRLSSQYSGGMKRRLSLACATIGQPQIIFLDECSTGVDPVARRDIWELVSNMVIGHGLPQADKPAVVLTTHSMDECEALCPRIGIMANGRLQCLGSAQHLKNKFGQGFQVELNVEMVKKEDNDYLDAVEKLMPSKNRSSADHPVNSIDSDAVFFNLDECLIALKRLTGDSSLSMLIVPENSLGYTVWKDATAASGVSLSDLAVFVATELRIRSIKDFVCVNFSKSILRERQDTKCRYEVDSDNIQISQIFSIIEENKGWLQLADYSVSQTSLEQVFNKHAEAAERQKQGRLDGNAGFDDSSEHSIQSEDHEIARKEAADRLNDLMQQRKKNNYDTAILTVKTDELIETGARSSRESTSRSSVGEEKSTQKKNRTTSSKIRKESQASSMEMSQPKKVPRPTDEHLVERAEC